MDVWYDKGIHLHIDEKHLLLDPIGTPTERIDLVIVSHGHWDHASGLDKMKNETILMSHPTRDYKKSYMRHSNVIKSINEGESMKINDLDIEAHRSGHCLGALQFRIVGKETTVVFTGDLNLKGTYIEASTPILKGDNLIIEANFGHPDYIFPNRLETFGKLGEWIHQYIGKKPIIIFAHALGKTQELTQFLIDLNVLRNGGNGLRCNLFMNSFNIKTNQLFEKYRYRFSNRYRSFTKAIDLQQGEFLIYPIREKPSLVHISKIKKRLNVKDAAFAYVSGWALRNRGKFCFPISSHSGFDELMEYVKKSGASNVYAFHGYTESFAKSVRELGISATALTPEKTFD